MNNLNCDVEKSEFITSDINRISPVFLESSGTYRNMGAHVNMGDKSEDIPELKGVNSNNQRVNIILRDRKYDMYNIDN